MTIPESCNVVAFPQVEPAQVGTDNPAAYDIRQWVYRHRLTRREMREGLASGKYQPTPDFMEALEEIERILEHDKHIS